VARNLYESVPLVKPEAGVYSSAVPDEIAAAVPLVGVVKI
jgi:hypothetical protein